MAKFRIWFWVKCVLAGIAAVGLVALAQLGYTRWLEHVVRTSMPGVEFLVVWRPFKLGIRSLIVFATGFWFAKRWLIARDKPLSGKFPPT